MPLIKRSSKAARAVNVRRLIDEGYPPRQAVAIAYSTQRAAKAKNRAGGKKAYFPLVQHISSASRRGHGALTRVILADGRHVDFVGYLSKREAIRQLEIPRLNPLEYERDIHNQNQARGRRNRAGRVRPKDEADARKIARDALQKAEKAIRSLRFDPESELIAQEDRAVAAFNRLRDRATDAAPYLPRDENDAITDALRNLRAMLDESIANASTVAKQARSKIYAAADREASIERLARAFQREGHSLADARKIARFRHENRAGGKRRGARR